MLRTAYRTLVTSGFEGPRRQTERRLWTDRRGSILPTFALLLPLILLGCGLGIDGASYINTKREVETAIDAATLAMISDFRKSFIRDSTRATQSWSVDQQKATGITYFYNNIQLPPNVTVEIDPTITVNGTQFSASVAYKVVYKPYILKIFGQDHVTIAGTAKAAAGVVPYLEVMLLIDTSGSMGLGVDLYNQDRLKRETGTGCAFACHDNVPIAGYADTFEFARAKGITLRYDAMSKALERLFDRFDSIDPSGKYIKTTIWSFDTTFKLDAALSNNTRLLRNAIPKAPSTGDDREGATRFSDGIGNVVRMLGNGGDGSNPSSPIKLLILATDGVEDPGRYWVSDVPARMFVNAFDMSFCATLKSRNIRVGVVHTPYVPIPEDWGFMATIGAPSLRGGPGSRLDDVTPALKACGENNYVEANDEQTIVDGFQKAFTNTIVPRLTN